MIEYILAVPDPPKLGEPDPVKVQGKLAGEIVRCKDCWKRKFDNCPFNEFSMFKPEDDFYCKEGRKEWPERRHRDP